RHDDDDVDGRFDDFEQRVLELRLDLRHLGRADLVERHARRDVGRLVMIVAANLLVASKAIWYLMRSSGVVSLVLLTAVIALGLALILTSLLRRRVGARLWRGVHWIAYLSWPVAFAHSLGLGTDASAIWLQSLAGACAVAVAASLARRLWKVEQSKHLELQPA